MGAAVIYWHISYNFFTWPACLETYALMRPAPCITSLSAGSGVSKYSETKRTKRIFYPVWNLVSQRLRPPLFCLGPDDPPRTPISKPLSIHSVWGRCISARASALYLSQSILSLNIYDINKLNHYPKTGTLPWWIRLNAIGGMSSMCSTTMGTWQVLP